MIKSVDELEKIGDSESLYELGIRYYSGKLVEQDFNKSAEYFEEAVKKGNIKGKYFLGQCYYYGKGRKKDYEKAYKIFDELVHNNENDLTENMLINMCGIMADMLHLGQYVKKDDGMAYEFYKLLAEQYNDKVSKFHMAEMCYYGTGVEQNREKAFHLFKELSEKEDYKEAIFYLPEMYFYGRGVEKNIAKAKKYAELAVENGDNYSAFFLAKIAYDNQDYENAAKYFEQALDEKYDDCYYYLGKLYSEYLDVADKEEKAEKYYSKIEKDILCVIFYYVLAVKDKDSINYDLIIELLRDPYEKFKLIVNMLPDGHLARINSNFLSSLTDEQVDEIENRVIIKIQEFSKENEIKIDFENEDEVNSYVLEFIK